MRIGNWARGHGAQWATGGNYFEVAHEGNIKKMGAGGGGDLERMTEEENDRMCIKQTR